MVLHVSTGTVSETLASGAAAHVPTGLPSVQEAAAAAIAAASLLALKAPVASTSLNPSLKHEKGEPSAEDSLDFYNVGPSKFVYPLVLPPAQRIPKYKTLMQLGAGTQSQVFDAIELATGKSVVLKCNRSRKDDKNNLGNYRGLSVEADFLREMGKKEIPYVPSLLDSFDVNKTEKVLVLENLGKADLYKTFLDCTPDLKLSMKEYFEWPHLMTIGMQLILALDIFKKNEVVHADLKPENMIFDIASTKLKILDFGLAQKASEMPSHLLQALHYRSPEISLKLKGSCEIDMWSAGCVLAELATGLPLYDSDTSQDHMEKICSLRGMPPAEWLDKSSLASQSFKKMEDGHYSLLQKDKAPCRPTDRLVEHLQDELRKCWPGIDADTIDQFVDLIDKMNAYRDRITPEEALRHSLFKDYFYWEILKKGTTPIGFGMIFMNGQPYFNTDLTKYPQSHWVLKLESLDDPDKCLPAPDKIVLFRNDESYIHTFSGKFPRKARVVIEGEDIFIYDLCCTLSGVSSSSSKVPVFTGSISDSIRSCSSPAASVVTASASSSSSSSSSSIPVATATASSSSSSTLLETSTTKAPIEMPSQKHSKKRASASLHSGKSAILSDTDSSVKPPASKRSKRSTRA